MLRCCVYVEAVSWQNGQVYRQLLYSTVTIYRSHNGKY